ncbi:hypothetical protein [Devosia sp. MC1541]|uniref:hypothetical protein n=1 Tax=Devosia sp. MC1541 TaxID=2725264 RepID=UPI00145E1198|nr:hypothetical protein [Devosia sp. MC1541]
MANDLYPVAGMRIFIGGAISVPSVDMTEADFQTALASAVEIDGWTQCGALGDNAAVITQALINRGRDYKMKGTANAGSMQNVFAAIDDDVGQIALIAAAQPANKNNYAVKIVGNDAPAPKSAAVTISNASPGVVSWANHGLANGTKVKFSTAGSLPTGLTADTEYYVVGADTGTFSVSATKGGSAINTTAAGSGTHTATTVPEPSERLFAAMAMSASDGGGEANTVRTLNGTLEINSNIVVVGRRG